MSPNMPCNRLRRGVEEYKKFATVQVEALNHALRGLPRDRIRFHLC